jgi:hypothetical protein
MNGTTSGNFEQHLCEYMFRNWERSNALKATLNLICRYFPLMHCPDVDVKPPMFTSWLGHGVTLLDESIRRHNSPCDELSSTEEEEVDTQKEHTADGLASADTTLGRLRYITTPKLYQKVSVAICISLMM